MGELFDVPGLASRWSTTLTGYLDTTAIPDWVWPKTPEHPIAEKIARYRGQGIGAHHLREFGLPLVKVRGGLATALRRSLVDLCDPRVLVRLGITPDRIVARSRETSRDVARTVLTSSAPGFRWWSAFFGEWHGLAIFLARLEGAPLEFGPPRPIERDDPDLETALEALAWSSDRTGRSAQNLPQRPPPPPPS